mmetsp:Transcript_11440/g.39177  ORF Transcript_11440/g.39177 Transcript_11440/m.39177 type:complete len:287 (-) Transcript_11440:1846-2706(-)
MFPAVLKLLDVHAALVQDRLLADSLLLLLLLHELPVAGHPVILVPRSGGGGVVAARHLDLRVAAGLDVGGRDRADDLLVVSLAKPKEDMQEPLEELLDPISEAGESVVGEAEEEDGKDVVMDLLIRHEELEARGEGRLEGGLTADDLGFLSEGLLAECLLIGLFELEASVVQALVVVLEVDLRPDLVHVPPRLPPLRVLVLQAFEHNVEGCDWRSSEEVVRNLRPVIRVDHLDDLHVPWLESLAHRSRLNLNPGLLARRAVARVDAIGPLLLPLVLSDLGLDGPYG